jgi:hypothetical protein
VDADEELASALRLALSQTRRAQLPPPELYASGAWDAATHVSAAAPVTPAAPPTPAPAARPWADTPEAHRAAEPQARSAYAEPAVGPGPGVRRAPSEHVAPHTQTPSAYAEPAVGPGPGVLPAPPAAAAPQGRSVYAEPGTGAREGARPAASASGSPNAYAPPAEPQAPTVEPVGGSAAGARASDTEWVAELRAAASSRQETRGETAGARPAQAQAVRAGTRSASGAGQRRGKGVRPALLGPRIGARLVDTVVEYAVVGVLGVVLAQRVTLHLQAKVDAARASGVPQTVWLIDGTVLADAGLLLAALLAVGLVYETIPLAVWGRSLGKAMFGLTVLDARTRARPNLLRTAFRTALCQTLVFLLIGILELVPCATDRKLRQSWHDKVGRTFVAKQ